MRNTVGLALVAVAVGVWFGGAVTTAQDDARPDLKTLADKVSYGIGFRMANSFGSDIDLDLLGAGFKDAIEKRDPILSEQEMMQVMQQFQQEQGNREMAKNKAAGEAFLTANKAKEGVVTLPSGLQYTILREGKGAKPTATDEVEVHYHGTLTDGMVFDSSVDRGKTINFPLNRVIRGWTEGVQLMQVGAKWKFFIPSDLAYGPQRRSAKIGPNETLLFEIELISIKGR